MQTRLEWMAGFFDGEGSISINVRKSRPRRPEFIQVVITITNCCREAVESFSAKFGGSITVSKRRKGWSTAYRWRRVGKSALEVLLEIEPHLVVKKEQARLAIKFLSAKWRCTVNPMGARWPPRTADQKCSDRNMVIGMARLNARYNGHARKNLDRLVRGNVN